MAVAAVIAAIIGTTTAIVSGVLSADAQDEAAREARELANIKRKDTLSATQETIGQSRESTAENRRQFNVSQAYTQKQDKLARQDMLEEKAHGRRAGAYANALGILNSNTQISDRLGQAWGAYK